MGLVPSNIIKLSSNFLTDRSEEVLLLWILFVMCVSCLYTILSCLFLKGWEMTDLLALLFVTFSCVLVTFRYGVRGQVWYLDCIDS